MEKNVKNNADAIIFHIANCASGTISTYRRAESDIQLAVSPA